MAASASSQQRRGKKGKRGAVDQEAVSANITKTMTAMRGAPTRGRGGRRFGSDMRAEMEEQREVTLQRATEFAAECRLHKVFETSAKTGFNVEEVFATVAKELYLQVKIESEREAKEVLSEELKPSKIHGGKVKIGENAR